MFVLAVTGGMGAGKTEAARFFGERGAVVLDLDRMAKALLDDPDVRDQLVAAFDDGLLGEEGRIDRRKLADVAFSSLEATRTLNGIVHPAVLREVMVGLVDLGLLERPPRVAVLDVPLLVEAPAIAELADSVLAIAAPEDVRVARALGRGMDEAQVLSRIATQAGDEERARIADAVIENAGSLDDFHAALASFWRREVGDDS